MARATSRLSGGVAVAALGASILTPSCSATKPSEVTGRIAQAETPDTFGIGSGRDSDFTVPAAGTVLNSYAPITAVNAAATQLTIGTVHGGAAGFVADNLVLVWRTTGLIAATSGTQTAVALTGDVGAYELGRVKSVNGAILTLTNPLSSATRFAASSQVVRVPEYTTLTVGAGSSVAAYPWDGTSGGIVAVFATVAIANGGAIQADAAGFRGGGVENAAIQTGCVSFDDWSNAAVNCGGAHKGEGLFPGAYAVANPAAAGAGPAATYGRGNYANAAGGGDAHNAGGGGGGNAGIGGLGGRTWIGDLAAGVPRAVGGLGGAAVTYSFATYLALGGGGGAGEENDMVGTNGGNGGGVVLLRAASLTGMGTVSAAGGGVTAVAGNDGSGGGGAGGAVVIEVSGAASCTLASASGGQGGSGGTDPDGPGGGGAGGYVLVEAASGVCAVKAAAGANGTTPTANLVGPAYGATAGAAGTTTAANGTGYAGTPCTQAVIAANTCGGCVLATDCPAGLPVCDPTSNLCAPCNGNFGSTATHSCPTAGAGVCVDADAGVDAGAGTCVGCATSADCTNPQPVCSSAAVCAPCNGDNGSGATSPCPAATPNCNTTSGACGTTCFTDAECGAGNWCNNLADAGACQPKVANGQPVPGGSCVTAVAMRACVSSLCVATGGLAGTCEACASDTDCTAATPVCDPASATCVSALSDAGLEGATEAATDATAADDAALDGQLPDASDAGLADVFDAGVDASADAGDAETADVLDAGSDATDTGAADATTAESDANDAELESTEEAGEDAEASVVTTPTTTGGTIEGGGISCSMTTSPRGRDTGWLAIALGAWAIGVTRRRQVRP
jgi:hypothetical protein